MRKIAALATCTALTVAMTGCGGMSEETTKQLAAQRAQIDKAKAMLDDQRATLEADQTTLKADQTAVAQRKANAVADIKRTRDTLSGQAKALHRTVSDL